MATVQSIGEAIKLIDKKKDELKKAYDDIQQNFPFVVSSLSLTWSDLDFHFSSLRNELTQKLHHLESLESGHQHGKDGSEGAGTGLPVPSGQPSAELDDADASPAPEPLVAPAELAPRDDPSGQSKPPSPVRVDSVPAGQGSDTSPEALAESPTSAQVQVDATDPSTLPPASDQPESRVVESRPELKALCHKVDGRGLINYVIEHGNERAAIRAELSVEIYNCPNPGKLILDAMGGFYRTKASMEDDALSKPRGIKTMRKSCIFLLEIALQASLRFDDRIKRRARDLALMWKNRANKDISNQAQILCLMLLVSAFELSSDISFEDLAEFFYFVASSYHGAELCKRLGLGDGIPELIQKLIDEKKELLAVRFILNQGLTKKFPPVVPLLKSYMNNLSELTVKAFNDERSSPKSKREALDKEMESLEMVIKLIQDHKLEAEYPKGDLQRRIEQLNKQKSEKKRAARAQERQNPKKHPQATTPDTSRTSGGFPPPLGSVSTPYVYNRPGSFGPSPSYQMPSSGLYGYTGPAPPQPYPHLYGNMPMPPYGGAYNIPPQYRPPFPPH